VRRFTPVLLMVGAVGASALAVAGEFRRLPVSDYVDKMKAGWVGQMAGVGQGGPTEFRAKGVVMDADRVPKWNPGMINQFGQDDIYVEMTFLQTLEKHGLDASIRQAGIDFAASGYALWHANNAGRSNLRKGIAPPDSGHPKFNQHADDIDYQIEADFAGLIAPGLPNVVIALGEKFGRLMNYGDGLYGGQFVGGMYAEAFFTSDRVKVVEAGLQCIPPDSQYAEMVRDMLQWFKADPDDWEKTWDVLEKKYHQDPKYTHRLCSGPGGKGASSIDAKLNGAYILMGLLYGGGDIDKTIVISTRCGQDSDCNPSNSAGVLCTTIGYAKLPEAYTKALNPNGLFSHTPYTFPKLISVCEQLVRQAVEKAGGRVEKDADGAETFLIPVLPAAPGKLEKAWEPGPIADSRFTDEEMAKIQETVDAARKARIGEERAHRIAPKAVAEAFGKFAPGWTMVDCGNDMEPGLHAEMRGKKNVFVTHPLTQGAPCVLTRKLVVPAGRTTMLRLVAGHHGQGDWLLVVKANGKELLKKTIGKETATDGWATVEVDLSALAGKEAQLEILNQPTGWSWEAAYWAEIQLRSE